MVPGTTFVIGDATPRRSSSPANCAAVSLRAARRRAVRRGRSAGRRWRYRSDAPVWDRFGSFAGRSSADRRRSAPNRGIDRNSLCHDRSLYRDKVDSLTYVTVASLLSAARPSPVLADPIPDLRSFRRDPRNPTQRV